MKTKFKLTLNLLFLVISLNVFSQSTSIPNVLNLKSAKNSGKIVENEKIVGYYVFYFKEKNDKKSSTYEVSIYDDNFKLKKNFEITRPKNSTLLETVFNGKSFLFYFFDSKMGLELVTIDKTGKQLGAIAISKKEMGAFEIQSLNSSIASGIDNISIYPLGNRGFIRSSYTKNKKTGYEVKGYDNNLKELWTIQSDENSNQMEFLEINEVSENYILSTVQKKKNALARSMETSCLIIDLNSGKLIKEVSLEAEDKGKLSILNSTYISEEGYFIVVGEYFKPGDNFVKDNSLGIYVQKLSESGKVLSINKFSWKGDINKFKQENLDEEDVKDANKSFYIYFHDIIVSKSGHISLIGEQYKKQVSGKALLGAGLGIAAAAAGGSVNNNASNFEIRIANMIVMELDEKINLIDFDVIQKRKTSVLLPQGAGLWSAAYLGHYVNSMGAFDYSFLSKDKANDNYTVVFRDYNRKEEGSKAKNDCMLGVINFVGGKRDFKRVAINSETKYWWVDSTKPGYVVVGEYFRKEKKVDLRLEGLNY